MAINLLVESDGSQPVQPADLRGGEQARRHQVACNRGHGLLHGYVEYRDGIALYGTIPSPEHYRRLAGVCASVAKAGDTFVTLMDGRPAHAGFEDETKWFIVLSRPTRA